jgi:hypothetical protein
MPNPKAPAYPIEFGADAIRLVRAPNHTLDGAALLTIWAYMRPSYGSGGTCLPTQVRSLSGAGLNRGNPMHLVAATSEASADNQRRRDLDRAALRATMRRPLIIDGRRLLPPAQLRSIRYRLERIGDGADNSRTIGPVAR